MNNVMDILDKHKDDAGVDVYNLKPGTKIKVLTKNNLYELESTGHRGEVWAKGGKYLPERCLVRFNGSTFGGSMIRMGWLAVGMYMEFYLGEARTLTTSCIQNIQISTDEWHYTL